MRATGGTLDPAFKAKLESLLGMRPDKQNRAVLWKDIEALRRQLIDTGGAGGTVVAGGGGGGTPPTGDPNYDALNDRLDLLALEITQAEQDANDALIAAQNALAGMAAASEYTDTAVAGARADFAIDYQTALDAAAAAGDAAVAADASMLSATNSAGAAVIARNAAVLAMTDAEESAAAAQQSLEQAARLGQGDGVVADQLFNDPAWTTLGNGTVTLQPQTFYPAGNQFRLATTLNQSAGIALVNPPASVWSGQRNAPAYVVSLEYVRVSGSEPAAGQLALAWVNTAGQSFWSSTPLLDATAAATSGIDRTRTARALLAKPANFTGTFSHHTLQLWSAHPDQSPRPATTLLFVRASVRIASEEEQGKGKVAEAVEAILQQNYLTAVDTNQAIVALDTTLTARWGGQIAQVTRNQTALTNLNGSVAKASLLTTIDGGSVIAGFEIASWNTNGQGTGAAVKIHGNVFAKGTVSVGALVVGLGGNLLQNSRFYDGETHWIGGNLTETTFGVRAPGSSYAHPSYATLMLYQSTPNNSRASYILYRPQDALGSRNYGAPAAPYKTYAASVYVSAHRCTCQISILFYDANGAQIASKTSGWQDPGSGAGYNPDRWARIDAIGYAPEGTSYVSMLVQKTGTQAGGTNSYLFIWKPQVEETHDKATEPTLYTSGEAGYFTGDMAIARTFTGRNMKTNELLVENIAQMGTAVVGSAQIRDASIDSAKIANIIQSSNFIAGANGRGWAIYKSGYAEFNTIKIRRQIEVASGSLAVAGRTWGTIGVSGGFAVMRDSPHMQVFAVTGIAMSAWMGTDKTYLAVAGISGASVTSPGGNGLWGWIATVAPLTVWSGTQRLRIMFELYASGISSISNHTIEWKLYEVS